MCKVLLLQSLSGFNLIMLNDDQNKTSCCSKVSFTASLFQLCATFPVSHTTSETRSFSSHEDSAMTVFYFPALEALESPQTSFSIWSSCSGLLTQVTCIICLSGCLHALLQAFGTCPQTSPQACLPVLNTTFRGPLSLAIQTAHLKLNLKDLLKPDSTQICLHYGVKISRTSHGVGSQDNFLPKAIKRRYSSYKMCPAENRPRVCSTHLSLALLRPIFQQN